MIGVQVFSHQVVAPGYDGEGPGRGEGEEEKQAGRS